MGFKTADVHNTMPPMRLYKANIGNTKTGIYARTWEF